MLLILVVYILVLRKLFKEPKTILNSESLLSASIPQVHGHDNVQIVVVTHRADEAGRG